MYTQEVADAICAKLAEGLSLRKACAELGGPHPTTVLGWADKNAGDVFAQQYARARAAGYRLLADEIIDISDEGRGDKYIDENGVERTDQDVVARSRLRVDSRKWMLSKMLPKIYGDKLETTIKGRLSVAREMTDDDLANIAATGGG